MAEYGCFHCGKGKSTNLSAKCPECHKPIDVKDDLLRIPFDEYKPIRFLGRGFYGYVLLVENRISKQFALKVVPETLYDAQDKDFYEEIRKYLLVGQHPNIAELHNAGDIEIQLNEQKVHLYYLVIEYIPESITFDELARSDLSDTLNSIDMFGGIAIQMCSALAKLEEKNLWHNDLHGGNILIKSREETDYDHDVSVNQIVKIVDFGSAVFENPGSVKQRTDIGWLGFHLKTLLDKIRQAGEHKTPYEQHFLSNANKIFFDTFDESPGRRPSPTEIIDRINKLRDESQSRFWEPPSLASAFGYTNALGFPNTSYVASLYSDKFPWIQDIVSAETSLLLTGPRGCGKTMILLNAQLRTILCRRSEDETNEQRMSRLRESNSLGFFISCRLSVHLDIATGGQPEWLNSPKLSILFFNLWYFSEILDTLTWANSEELDVISEQECNDLARQVEQCFEGLISRNTQKLYGGLSRLEKTQGRLAELSENIIRGGLTEEEVPAVLSTARPLKKIARYLSENITSLQGKRVVFLLDDFSYGIVPENTQRALLPLVFCTVPEYVFWVTAHGMSIPMEDLSGITYQPNREFVEINFGWEYACRTIPQQLTVCQEYLEDVFQKRFQLANDFVGNNLSQLLGQSDYGARLGGHIRELAESNNLSSLNYHGFDTITRLCTGDISYVIDLVGKILSGSNNRFPVSKLEQNKQIRAYARQTLLRLLDDKHGQSLYDVAKTFGLLSKEKLLGKLVGKKKQRPAQYLRIELTRSRLLSEECEKLLRRLIWEGVFINGPGTSSSKGETTLMLLYRRLLVPAAPTCLSDQDTFSWSPQRLEKFLRNPRSFLAEEISMDKATGPTLFDDLEQLQTES